MKVRLSAIFAFLLACGTVTAQTSPHLHVTVSLARSISTVGVSGRLLIFMSNKADSPLRPTWGSDPRDLWMAAKEVAHLAPGDSVELDADDLAFPEPFSKAPAGEYRLRAVLDTNHTYAYAENDDDGDCAAKSPSSTCLLTISQ